MLHTYLSLLKGIHYIVPLPSPDVREHAKRWLARSFAPSQIGFLPNSGDCDPSFRSLGFVLNYPHGSTARVFTELSPDVPSEIRDSLVLSSCYLAPLILIGDALWQRFAPYAFWTGRSHRLLDEKDLLRALQQASEVSARLFLYSEEVFYAIRDYLNGEMNKDALQILLHKRRIQINQEAEKLFADWSLSSAGPTLFFLADPLSLIGHWLTAMKRELIAQLPWDDFASAGMGIAVGVILLPEVLRRVNKPQETHRGPVTARRPFRPGTRS
ncbi:MAG: hypothetical protein NZ959_06475 [Armatimonadetes bacterium]|nr:hypothetical protein [Armatimonadota bacterium]MDW8122012.1 hypothetical protein [Armatimonadota bacterium]